jgi:hypothetical protein
MKSSFFYSLTDLNMAQKEGEIMAGQILVSLSSHDRIQEIIPQIEQVAEPGMKITLLMSYPVDRWAWLRDHWIDSESPKDAMSKGRKVLETYSYDGQRQLAEQTLVPMRNKLLEMGMEVTVDIYAGPLSTVLETYACKGDVQLLQPRRSLAMTRLMHKIAAFLGSFKKASSPQVLHPGGWSRQNR